MTAQNKGTKERQGDALSERAKSEPPVPALRPAAPDPGPRRRLWRWAAAALLVITLAGLAFSQVWMARPTPVAVEVAALAPVTRVLAINGRIAAARSVEVRSVVSGNLQSLFASEGDSVQAGQDLAQVDAAAQTAAVRQAMAGLDAALVAQQQATEAYDRAVSLGSNVPRTVLETTAHAVETATQEVARLKAVLDQAKIVLETYTIRAPTAGTVLELDAEQGQFVGPSTRLLTLADLSELEVAADVDETYATQIALDQQAVMQLAGQTTTRTGRLRFVSNRVDQSTGGLAVKIRFDTPVTAPVGLTVATNIIVDQRDAALTVPRAALLNGNAVFVVQDGIATRQPVAVVDWPAARLIVTAGLAVGDVIIMDATGITEGQAVLVEKR